MDRPLHHAHGRSMTRWLYVLLMVSLVCSWGGDEPVAKKKKTKPKAAPQAAADKTQKAASQETPRKKRRLPGAWEDEPNMKAASLPVGAAPRIGDRNFGFAAPADASQLLFDQLRDALSYGPTLVVWLVDNTSASATLRGQVLPNVRSFYSNHKTAGKAPDHLLSVVIPYGDRAPTELPEPTSNATEIMQAFDQLPQGDGNSAATFATVKAAGEHYLPYRTQKQREVLFVVLTAQRGADWQQADAPIALLRKNLMPVYVVGWPAPLGKLRLDEKSPIEIGPESRDREAISMESVTGGHDLEVMDSGFGPFALEWLARDTDGKFIALRPTYQPGGFSGPLDFAWPSSDAPQFDPQVMKKYAPDYVSEAEYQNLLQGNAACRALHEAAKLPRVQTRAAMTTQFTKRNDAQFARDVSKGQQAAASLQGDIDRLYEVLAAGEGERSKLTSPRWQAQYDVAIGRAAAAKARTEGYNLMLAAIKIGKTFANPGSTKWVLVPADTTDAGSAITKLIERSQTYLKRVVAEHPGTPWAMIAEQELQTQAGWKWTEE